MSSKKTIGAGIGLDGEKEFKNAIKEINSNLGYLKSEMNKTTSAFDSNGKSMNDLRSKSEVLTKQVDSQKEKVETLKKALENAKNEYGENSKQVRSWQIQLNNAEADLNKMNNELDELKSQTTGINKLKNAFADVEDKIETLKTKTSGLKNVVSSVGNGLASIGKIGGLAITGMTATATAAVTGFFSLAESTKETQFAMSKLDQSFSSAELGADNAQYAVSQLYGILGDTDRSVEASALLAKMSKNEKDLQTNTRILTGVFSQYGDSIPTEGLAEGMQATAAMGNVQGVLADALEWQGINLDEYNKKLAELSSEEERAAYVQQTLTELYGESADAYRKNNSALIEANETQLSIEQSLASIGEVATPALNTLKGFGASLLEDVLPGMETFGIGLEGLFNGEDGAIEQVSIGVSEMLDSLIKNATDILPQLVDVVGGVAPEIVTSLTSGLSENKEELTESAVEVVTKLASGLIDCAPDIIDVGLDLIIGLIDGLTSPESMEKLIGGAIECIGKITSTLIEKIPDILAIGGQIIEGLWNGIKDKDGWLREKISSFFGGVKQSIKDFFGIASPSKWARYEIMGNVMDSFGLAIDENADKVKNKMTAFTTSLQDDVRMQYRIETLTDRISAAQPSPKIVAATYSQYEAPSSVQTVSNDKFDRMLALLEIIAMNSKKDLLIDKKTLVGELVPEINEELGDILVKQERGA